MIFQLRAHGFQCAGALRLEGGDGGCGFARVVVALALQQQIAVGGGHLEVEAVILLAVLLEDRRGRCLVCGLVGGGGRGILHRRQTAQAHGRTQFTRVGSRLGTRLLGTGQQDTLHFGRVGNQLGIALAHGRNLAVDALEQHLLGFAPGDAIGKGLRECRGFLGRGKGLVDLEQGRTFGLLGFARRARIGHDGQDALLHLGLRHEQRNGVVVALAHLAAVQTGQQGHLFVHLGFGQHQQVLAIQVVEAAGHVARHLDVLDLVAAHWHLVGLEHQDVGGHQHRVHEQAGGHAIIRLLAGLGVLVDRGLVGMGAVEQALAGDAGQHPGQLGNLGDIALAVEGDTLGVQARSQPGGGDFQRGALDADRVIALDQRVVVGQEVVAFHVRAQAGLHGRAHRADIVAQVGRAGGGDAGEEAGNGGGDHVGKAAKGPPMRR